jgi:hypothetical protein
MSSSLKVSTTSEGGDGLLAGIENRFLKPENDALWTADASKPWYTYDSNSPDGTGSHRSQAGRSCTHRGRNTGRR